ncbi:MAG TPA: sulfurtransferase-like selenium metabolism protein YedF [Syntrophomonadaceae bacterium]|jgi:selenium metabolism protein YedF|nr:sulfurtransferase-like selenium metabolism protein YedF [Syntrophomonadaceae bacterium]
MRQVVDARGLSCPQPVILTKKALDNVDVHEVVTIVDNKTAVENVSKLAKSMKLESVVDTKGEEYYINILKEEGLSEANNQKDSVSEATTVVMIASNLLGQGDAKLGATLMKNMLYTLTQMEAGVSSIIFMNSGVLLTTEGSDVIEYIAALEESGIQVLSCGTCLDFYGLGDKLRVGSVSNMYTIMETLLSADRVLNF